MHSEPAGAPRPRSLSARVLAHWLLSLAPLLLPVLTTLACAPAAATAVPENDMKAAYVFNFAVFTSWPAEVLAGAAPLSLCVSQANPLYPSLAQLNDKLVNGHRLSLKPSSGGAIRTCHLLLLDRSDRERWPQLKRELAGAPVLTVADDSVIGADGAIIALVVANQRIAFDIDMGAAREAQLAISSKLLRLARSVQ